MTRKPILDIESIAPPPIVPQVRNLIEGEALVEIASFAAGRVRVVFDHNGNAELTMRVPAQDKGRVIPMTDYPGVEMIITASVPEGVIE